MLWPRQMRDAPLASPGPLHPWTPFLCLEAFVLTYTSSGPRTGQHHPLAGGEHRGDICCTRQSHCALFYCCF